MKTRIAHLLFAGLLFCSALHAQYTISGSVYASDAASLPFANVLLKSTTDSSLISGQITDENGDFILEVSTPVSVFVSLEYLGYEPWFSGELKTGVNTDIGQITLIPESESLDAVAVVARRPLYEQKIDRMVINVQKSITSSGNTALHVLSKAPSVVVDRATETIRLLGNEGVVVMINNKEVRMENRDLISLLESMPADNIQNIEVITTPPARYDVEGNAGIININTIRQDKKGFSGRFTLNAGYGDRPKAGGSLNLNYQGPKIYIYTNLSTNNDFSSATVAYDTDFLYDTDRVQTNLDIYRKYYTGLHMGEVGIAYNLSPNAFLGGSFNIRNRDWRLESETQSTQIKSESLPVNETILSTEDNLLLQTISNLHFRKTWNENSNVSIDYDYISFNRDNPSYYEIYKDENTIPDQKFVSEGKTPLAIQVIRTDLEHFISDRLALEAGGKTTFSAFENDVRVADIEDGLYIDDPAYTDFFNMNEEIYAAYISFDIRISQMVSLKSGLRYEYYSLNLNSESDGKMIEKAGGDIFPTAYLSIKPSENYELNLSFARRTDRPGFMQLAPAFYFFSPNTLYTGNPNLLPAYSSQYKIDFRFKTLSTSIQYLDTRQPINEWQTALDDELQLFTVQPLQGKRNQALSFSANIPWQITKWWGSRYTLNINYLAQDYTLEGIDLEQESFVNSFNTTQNLELGKGFEIEATAGIFPAHTWTSLHVDTRMYLDLGIRKTFKDESSLSLNLADVFDSGAKWHLVMEVADEGMFYDRRGDYEGTIFRVSYSKPLGTKRQENSIRRHNSGAQEELQRLN